MWSYLLFNVSYLSYFNISEISKFTIKDHSEDIDQPFNSRLVNIECN